jgi:hypothetical protein
MPSSDCANARSADSKCRCRCIKRGHALRVSQATVLHDDHHELLTLVRVESAPAAASEAEQKRRQLFHALLRVVCRLAGSQPLLVMIEDIHWSDETTLEFLPFMCRYPLPTAPLSASRTDDLPQRPPPTSTRPSRCKRRGQRGLLWRIQATHQASIEKSGRGRVRLRSAISLKT